MSRFNFTPRNYDKVIAAVQIFKNMIDPLGLSDREVVEAEPLRFRAALVAAAAISGARRSMLENVLFGMAAGRSSGSYWGDQSFRGTGPSDRFKYYDSAADLVALAYGPKPPITVCCGDESLSLFIK